ncbi:uncharacterized protein LOC142539177 [Primulina tabacum]|uniref:uncharacterized protein LOC142539177 n=1 Tax=Primulina tabacum TaxID=48773 RepID=UPI003F5A5972
MASPSFSPSQTRFLALFFSAFLLLVHPFSAAAPEYSPSPSPSPRSPAGVLSPPPGTPSPSPANSHYSPPAPPPQGPSPTPAPSPAAVEQKSPPLVPVGNGGVNHENQKNADESDDGSSGGMSGGKKAGIAIGVIGAASIVGIGAFVYKKRQQNLRRSEYGYAARREFL